MTVPSTTAPVRLIAGDTSTSGRLSGVLFGAVDNVPITDTYWIRPLDTRIFAVDFQICATEAASTYGYLDLELIDAQNHAIDGERASRHTGLLNDLTSVELAATECRRGWVAFVVNFKTNPGPFQLRWAPLSGPARTWAIG